MYHMFQYMCITTHVYVLSRPYIFLLGLLGGDHALFVGCRCCCRATLAIVARTYCRPSRALRVRSWRAHIVNRLARFARGRGAYILETVSRASRAAAARIYCKPSRAFRARSFRAHVLKPSRALRARSWRVHIGPSRALRARSWRLNIVKRFVLFARGRGVYIWKTISRAPRATLAGKCCGPFRALRART